MCPGQIPPGHVLVHFVISHHFLTRFAASFLSLQPPSSPPTASYFLPATASHSLQHSPVMWTQCCLFTACKPSSPRCLRHALVRALFSCQSVAVTDSRRWWLGTGGTLYKWGGGMGCGGVTSRAVGSRLLEVTQSFSLNILWLVFILFCNRDPSKNGEIMELQCDNNQYNQREKYNGYNKLKGCKMIMIGL